MKIKVKLYSYGEMLTSYDVTAYKTMRGFRLHGLKKELDNLGKYFSPADTVKIEANGQQYFELAYMGLNGWTFTNK